MDIVLFILRVLIAVALYAFLGVVLAVLLSERRAPGFEQPEPAALVRLESDGTTPNGTTTAVISQANRSAYSPSYRMALRHPTWIGRDPNCAVRINNEFVSVRHARVEWHEDRRAWWIVDNDSRNGTLINDERVMSGELKDADIIVIGGVRFKFELDEQHQSSIVPFLRRRPPRV